MPISDWSLSSVLFSPYVVAVALLRGASYWATLFWQTFVHNFFLVRLNFKRLQVISWNYCLLMLKCFFSHAAWFICGMILANGKQCDPVIPQVNIGRFRLWTLNNKFEKIFDKIFVYNFLCRPLDFHLFISFKAQTMARFPVNYFIVALFAFAGCWAGRVQLPKEVEITSEASTSATTSDVQSTDSTVSTTVTATTTRPARTTTIGPPSKGTRIIIYF